MCVIPFIVATAAFLLFEAKSMLEYGTTFFAIISLMVTVTVYLICLNKRAKCSAYIGNCEKFIAQSKWRSSNFFFIILYFGFIFTGCHLCATGDHSAIAYTELSGKIELICRVFCFAFIISPPIMTIAILLLTIVNYYIFDMGADSFTLVFAVVWVKHISTHFGMETTQIVTFYFFNKFAIRLEDAVRIFGGMVFTNCWRHGRVCHCNTIPQFILWIMLAVHVRRWRHYQWLDSIQWRWSGKWE